MQAFSSYPLAVLMHVYIGCTASNKTPAGVSGPGCGYMLQTVMYAVYRCPIMCVDETRFRRLIFLNKDHNLTTQMT